MRYDGYYILSDLLEIPNLRQKATTILGRITSKWCLGIDQPEDPFLPSRNRGLFALYAVASSVYSWMVTASIFLFVWSVFKPYRLEVLGQLLAMGALWGLVVRPAQAMVRFLNVPGRREEVKVRNLVGTSVVAAALVSAVALIPLPQRVWCPAELRPRGEETVYVSVPGRLESVAVRPGDSVEEGTELGRLSSVDLDLAIADLEGKASQSRSRLQSLQRERFTDPAAGLEIGTVEESLKSVEEQLARRRQDRSDLVLRAPRAGVVLPAPAVRGTPGDTGRLPNWSGHVLDPQNLGALLAEGSVFCHVGDPASFEAVMVVDQSEMEFVLTGQKVDLKLDALPWRTFRGSIAEIAEASLEAGAERLSVKAGGQVPTRTDESGRETPISTSFEALMAIDDPDALFTPGMRGTARIRVGQRTVGSWLARLLWQTFNFRM